jgi:hypothetical protein
VGFTEGTDTDYVGALQISWQGLSGSDDYGSRDGYLVTQMSFPATHLCIYRGSLSHM